MPLIDAMMSYKNIFIRNLDLIEYAKDTPAEEWIKSGNLYQSIFMKVHVSDFLRLCRYIYNYIGINEVNLISFNFKFISIWWHLLGLGYCDAKKYF